MKKRISFIFIIMAVFLVLSGCQSIDTPDKTDGATEEVNLPTEAPAMLSFAEAVPAIPEGASGVQLGFNLALLKKLGELEGGNLFYSPMSINAAMTMAYFGADGDTQQEIADTLGYKDMDITQVAAYQKYLLQSYADSGDTAFTTANSIWLADFFEAKQAYMDTMEDVFETEVTRLDFVADDAIGKLNLWIDKSTNHMIEKLFEEKDNPFDANTAMILMNAIYFNGLWTAPFDPEKTYDTDFNGLSEPSAIRMMSSEETVMGNQGENYISVSLPYGEDERFTMVAVLPEDVDAFIDGLTEEILDGILNTFYEQHDPVVQLPVFEMEQKVKLNDALYALGIEKAFTPSADFSVITEETIWIDEVLHKARIKVDEEGTEAAAVTSVEMTLKGMPLDRFEFIADKPFLFFIVDTQNDLVLFTGKVCDLG